MSLREYSTFCKSGNNSIRVYCDSLRNLSTMAKDITTSIQHFIACLDCAQYSLMPELVNALEELIPYLNERADCYYLRAERTEDILVHYSVNYTVSRTTYEFLIKKMLAGDSVYSPSIENAVDQELSTIMAAIKSFYDLAAGVDEFERQLYDELGKMPSMDGYLSGSILLKEILVEPFYHRKPNADCNTQIIKAQIHWRTYLQDHILCEARKQNEIIKMARILKTILHNISEENSNFLQCVRDGHGSFDIGFTQLSTIEDWFWNYRRNGQLSIRNSLHFPHSEDFVQQYILEKGLEQAWYASSPLFLYEQNERYAEDNLWIMSDDLRKIAYVLAVSSQWQNNFSGLYSVFSSTNRTVGWESMDAYLIAATKLLGYAKELQNILCDYSCERDLPDFMKNDSGIDKIEHIPETIDNPNFEKLNSHDAIEEFAAALVSSCSSNNTYASAVDRVVALYPYAEENVQRNTDDVVLLNCFVGYISLKLQGYANYPYRNERYTALSKVFGQIGKDLETICISIEDEIEELYKAIFSVAYNLQNKDPEILQYFTYEYPFTAESLSWRHGEGMKPLPLSKIHIDGHYESAYHISSFSKYGGMTEYYNGRHMRISWMSTSGGWA